MPLEGYCVIVTRCAFVRIVTCVAIVIVPYNDYYLGDVLIEWCYWKKKIKFLPTILVCIMCHVFVRTCVCYNLLYTGEILNCNTCKYVYACIQNRNIIIDYHWLPHWRCTVNLSYQIGIFSVIC